MARSAIRELTGVQFPPAAEVGVRASGPVRSELTTIPAMFAGATRS